MNSKKDKMDILSNAKYNLLVIKEYTNSDNKKLLPIIKKYVNEINTITIGMTLEKTIEEITEYYNKTQNIKNILKEAIIIYEIDGLCKEIAHYIMEAKKGN